MPGLIRTHLLPSLAGPAEAPFAGGLAVVIDQLRASTTICAAIAAGAEGVYPFLEPEHALEQKAKCAQAYLPIVLGGERGGVLIPGFDLDNSPRAYTAQRIAGKAVFFTTTNGTKAIALAERASAVLIGCLANLSALVQHIEASDRLRESTIHLICCGTRDRVTLEDVLAAGAIAARLAARAHPTNLDDTRPDDDSTLLALALWRQAQAEKGGVLSCLLNSRGGRNLCRLGLREDVEFCAVIDALPVVPWLSPNGAFVGAAGQV